MMKRLLLVLVMVMVGTAVAAPPCWACSCAPSTKKQDAKTADVIFTGRVQKITGIDYDNGSLGDDNAKVRFRVGKVYKGHPQRITRVYTNESEAACGYAFKEGKRYTVFANWHNDKKKTSLCSGTKQGRINPDNYSLGNGYPPGE